MSKKKYEFAPITVKDLEADIDTMTAFVPGKSWMIDKSELIAALEASAPTEILGAGKLESGVEFVNVKVYIKLKK